VQYALKFARMAKAEGYAISEKSAIMSTCRKIAIQIQKALREEGVECRIANEVRDLGINNTLAKKRGKKDHEVRMTKAKRRAEK
jgi:hypothetical protein